MTTDTIETNTTEMLAGRLFAAGVGAFELCGMYVGIRLDLYRILADGPLSATELAARTGCAERYLREWLQHQAVAGLLTAHGDDPATARFTLADGVADVLVDETGPAYLGGLPYALAALGRVLPALADAYRTGAPVPYATYGPDAVSAQSALNRPAFVNSLVAEWLPQIPDVHARLRDTAHPARVGDFGCGPGWSAIELAKAFPHLPVDGLDNDDASIAAARRNAVAHGVADRVDMEVRDLADDTADWSPRYDVVFFFECVHDFPRPVEVLRHARATLVDGGTVIVMDERTADTFTAPGDDAERFFAAASALWCLPQGLVGGDPQPVGALIRPSTMDTLARQAGYHAAETLPISGSIVNIASPAATVSLDRYGLAGYSASKAAVVALTRELAAQWADRGVRVNAISPSWFPTATTGHLQDPDQVAWINAHTPMAAHPAPTSSTARCCSWPATPPATSPGTPWSSTAAGPRDDHATHTRARPPRRRSTYTCGDRVAALSTRAASGANTRPEPVDLGQGHRWAQPGGPRRAGRGLYRSIAVLCLVPGHGRLRRADQRRARRAPTGAGHRRKRSVPPVQGRTARGAPASATGVARLPIRHRARTFCTRDHQLAAEPVTATLCR